ncbi:MAG: type 4a pilus biogenesis protein PilO [Acidobacteriota bacterium]
MALDVGLDNKPWYFGFIIGLLLASGIVYASYTYLVTDMNQQIQAADDELDELARKIQAGRSAEKKLPQFREEVKRLELELDKLRRILPSSRNTEEIIKKIKALVDQGDFVLNRMSGLNILNVSDQDAYKEWPISVSVQGGYHNLAILFNRLSNFSRIMNVEKFTITATSDQSERTITSDFIAKTFVYMEPTTTTTAPGAGKPGGAPAGQ